MKATNTLAPSAKKEKKSFSAVISGEGAQKLIRASLRDDGSVKRFTGTLISVVKASKQLSECDPGSVIAAALRGEGAGLIYGHGYYVVPYGEKATYITSYKGYIQLAIATGLYADIDCIDVREGERKGRDKRTGKPIVDMSVYETDAERDQHPIIGYKAYFELRDGYYREEYWTVDEILRHADRYSKAFSIDLYQKWQRGEELTKDERYSVENGTPWYTSFDRMAKKTVLRSLLNSGFAPLSNETKSLLENDNISGEAVMPDFGDSVMPDYSGMNDEIVETTGDVVDAPDACDDAAGGVVIEDAASNTPVEEKPHKRERKPRVVDVGPDDDEEAIIGSFFGDGDAQ